MNFSAGSQFDSTSENHKIHQGQGPEAHKPIQQKPSTYRMAGVYKAGTSDGCHVKRLQADITDRNLREMPPNDSRQTPPTSITNKNLAQTF